VRDELLGGRLCPDGDGNIPIPDTQGLGLAVNEDYVRSAGQAVAL
jgi:hypothetical protein